MAPSKLKVVESPTPESLIKFENKFCQFFVLEKKKILTMDDMILEREIWTLNLRKLYGKVRSEIVDRNYTVYKKDQSPNDVIENQKKH